MERTSVKKARFPEFCDKFRELQGSMTDVEFGKKLGLSRQTVGFYRNGDRIPDALGLRDIAQKCDVSTDYLLGLTDCPAVDDKERAACEYTGLYQTSIQYLHDLVSSNDSMRIAFDDFIDVAGTILLHANTMRDLANKAGDCYEAFNNGADCSDICVSVYGINSELICTKVSIIEDLEHFLDRYADYSNTREILEYTFRKSLYASEKQDESEKQ